MPEVWTRFDFDVIEDLYYESSQDYSPRHPNQDEARTLLTSVCSIEQVHLTLLSEGRTRAENEHMLQAMYLHRGVYALEALFWLCKHHCYSACYGRIRFLFELYLIVRSMNQDKPESKRKYQELRNELEMGDYGPYDPLPIIDWISGRRQQLKGDLASKEELYGKMYQRISNLGSHPHSIKSAELDGSWDEVQERDILQLGLIFTYAVAVQYIRTFEDSPLEIEVKQAMDDIIVQVLLSFSEMPLFLGDDLDFTFSF